MNVTVTEKAITTLREHKEHDVQLVRMSVMPGGCSGFKYNLVLEDASAEDDLVIEAAEDVHIIVDPFSAQYLENVILDYTSTLTGSGFTFNNPNATGGCGCGSSFSA